MGYREDKLDGIITDMVILSALYKGMSRSKSIPEGESILSPRYVILGILAREGPMTMTSLSRRSQLSKQHLTAIADGLVGDKLVQRQPSDIDRRVVTISITDEGKAAYAMSKKLAKEALAERLLGLSDEDVDRLYLSITEMKEILLKLEEEK